jgi:hypothetical protein
VQLDQCWHLIKAHRLPRLWVKKATEVSSVSVRMFQEILGKKAESPNRRFACMDAVSFSISNMTDHLLMF